MPQAVFHIIFAILIAEAIRFSIVNKKSFPIYYAFIAGIAGILPDIDVLAFIILNNFGFALSEVHRTFTHNLFFPAIFILLGGIFWKFGESKVWKHSIKWRCLFFLISLGILIHLVLDATIYGNIMLFYPISKASIGLNLAGLLPHAIQNIFLPSLDAAIFIIWLAWLEFKHKISNFI